MWNLAKVGAIIRQAESSIKYEQYHYEKFICLKNCQLILDSFSRKDGLAS